MIDSVTPLTKQHGDVIAATAGEKARAEEEEEDAVGCAVEVEVEAMGAGEERGAVAEMTPLALIALLPHFTELAAARSAHDLGVRFTGATAAAGIGAGGGETAGVDIGAAEIGFDFGVGGSTGAVGVGTMGAVTDGEGEETTGSGSLLEDATGAGSGMDSVIATTSTGMLLEVGTATTGDEAVTGVAVTMEVEGEGDGMDGSTTAGASSTILDSSLTTVGIISTFFSTTASTFATYSIAASTS